MRHRDVEHDGVVAACVGQPVERLAPVGGQLDVVRLEPQRALERRPHRGLVVDDQHAHHPKIMPSSARKS